MPPEVSLVADASMAVQARSRLFCAASLQCRLMAACISALNKSVQSADDVSKSGPRFEAEFHHWGDAHAVRSGR